MSPRQKATPDVEKPARPQYIITVDTGPASGLAPRVVIRCCAGHICDLCTTVHREATHSAEFPGLKTILVCDQHRNSIRQLAGWFSHDCDDRGDE